MKFASVCSGIGAPEYAWKQLGWECVWASEIEPFARAVYAHHYPDVPLFGDFTKLDDKRIGIGAVNLLVGGTPCQAFSVAGKRLGLDDPRGNLAIEFLRLAQRLRTRWLVWENVAGVLSSERGRDFGAFLGLLAECGYGWAYRVLDAQYFGVPQRRKRVFLVGCLGNWRAAAAVLFERESLSGHPAPSRKAGAGASFCVTSRFGSGRNDPTAETYIAFANTAGDTNLGIDEENGSTPPITTRHGDPGMVAFSCKDYGADALDGIAPTLRALGHHKSHANAGGQLAVVATSHVRRLTPRECERLMGFPDDYTLVTYRGKPAADGPRYRALGNSIVTNVLLWIGERIQLVEQILKESAA